MTTTDEIQVPDSNAVFLAVAAQNYADADLAFWRLKQHLGDCEPGHEGQQRHLDKLRERRKETYSDLVAWVMMVEAERLGNVVGPADRAGVVGRIVVTNAAELRESMGEQSYSLSSDLMRDHR